MTICISNACAAVFHVAKFRHCGNRLAITPGTAITFASYWCTVKEQHNQQKDATRFTAAGLLATWHGQADRVSCAQVMHRGNMM